MIMSKWKCEICGSEFDNFHAQGFDNKIYCPLCFFKEENKRLKDELDAHSKGLCEAVNDKNDSQQRIDKAIEYIQNGKNGKGQCYSCCVRKVSIAEDKELLSILKGKEVK